MIKAGNITGDNTKITKIPIIHIAEYAIISLILITPFSNPLPLLTNDLAQQPSFIYDSVGKITGYKTSGGADTVFPFSGNKFYQYTLSAKQTFPDVIIRNGETYYFVGIISMDITKNNGGGYSPSYFNASCKIAKTSSGYSVSLTTLNEGDNKNYYGSITAIYRIGSAPEIVDLPA